MSLTVDRWRCTVVFGVRRLVSENRYITYNLVNVKGRLDSEAVVSHEDLNYSINESLQIYTNKRRTLLIVEEIKCSYQEEYVVASLVNTSHKVSLRYIYKEATRQNMAQVNIHDTIRKYESFINDVLKEDLRQLELRLQQVNAEVTDLVQQKQTLKVVTDKKVHPNGFKSQVNIGCNFFMEATITDTSTMLFNIGLNHYVEFSLAEAHKYLNARIEAFEKKSEELIQKSAETKAHIKLMLFGIGELQNQEKGVGSKLIE